MEYMSISRIIMLIIHINELACSLKSAIGMGTLVSKFQPHFWTLFWWHYVTICTSASLLTFYWISLPPSFHTWTNLEGKFAESCVGSSLYIGDRYFPWDLVVIQSCIFAHDLGAYWSSDWLKEGPSSDEEMFKNLKDWLCHIWQKLFLTINSLTPIWNQWYLNCDVKDNATEPGNFVYSKLFK